jgi:hypothetical protein
MRKHTYTSIDINPNVNRREFVKSAAACSAAAGSLVLGVPAFGQETRAAPVETNIGEFMKVPKTDLSIPGPFPGRVVKVTDPRSLQAEKIDARVVAEMFEKGVTGLTGRSMAESFKLWFKKDDVIGLKVNPVGPPLIHTKPELVEAVIEWLATNGVARQSLVIWDRFDYMLADAGYTPQRFPGIRIEGLQTMDESGNRWRDKDGNHVSINNFDQKVFYYAKGVVGKGVRGYKDDEFYLNQHVFNGEYSYFGKLLTQRLTKIINLAAYKNTGSGISMATKNLSFGSICNAGRLHAPLFFKVCTEVIAAPVIRDKLVLNVTDGIRGQYDGGPDKNAQFVYPNHSLYFATDPFALDMTCHNELMAKRREMGAQVNDNPRFTDYLHYADQLGLGIADVKKIRVVTVKA